MPSSRLERAKLFLMYDSLKGFKKFLKAKEEVVIPKKELACDAADLLDYKLKQVRIGEIITIVYYENNRYLKLEGMVSKLDTEFTKTIMIVKKVIPLKDIIELDADYFIE